MLTIKYNEEYPAHLLVSSCIWAIIFGYFALGYDTDPDTCYATDESDY